MLASEIRATTTVDSRKMASVKRCLFGEPDHAHVRSELVRQLQAIRSSDMAKWNFDFSTGKPLSGRYCWEPITEPVTPTTREEMIKTPETSPTSEPRESESVCANTVTPIKLELELEVDAITLEKIASRTPTPTKSFANKRRNSLNMRRRSSRTQTRISGKKLV